MYMYINIYEPNQFHGIVKVGYYRPTLLSSRNAQTCKLKIESIAY